MNAEPELVSGAEYGQGADPRTIMLVLGDEAMDLRVCTCDNVNKQKFVAFCEMHPNFLEDMRREALQAASMGHRGLGARLIFESLRWNHLKMTDAKEWNADEYRLPNAIVAYASRKLMMTTPELFRFFEVRVIVCGICGYPGDPR